MLGGVINAERQTFWSSSSHGKPRPHCWPLRRGPYALRHLPTGGSTCSMVWIDTFEKRQGAAAGGSGSLGRSASNMASSLASTAAFRAARSAAGGAARARGEGVSANGCILGHWGAAPRTWPPLWPQQLPSGQHGLQQGGECMVASWVI